jgi:hypothetical protein
MQFPVPQFTDVEDKIIGSLTVKQFGILFGSGTLVFLSYSATKNTPTLVIATILIGLPALGIAFGKINGRPVYNSFGFIFRYVFSDKIMVFHREISAKSLIKDASIAETPVQAPQVSAEDTQTRLKDINRILQSKAQEEKELLKEKKL